MSPSKMLASLYIFLTSSNWSARPRLNAWNWRLVYCPPENIMSQLDRQIVLIQSHWNRVYTQHSVKNTCKMVDYFLMDVHNLMFYRKLQTATYYSTIFISDMKVLNLWHLVNMCNIVVSWLTWDFIHVDVRVAWLHGHTAFKRSIQLPGLLPIGRVLVHCF